MHSFAYKNGTLYCENVNLQELADKESTPLYVYSKQTILNHFHRLRKLWLRLTRKWPTPSRPAPTSPS